MRSAYNLSGAKIQFSHYLPVIKISKKKWVELSQIGLILGIILLSILSSAVLSIGNALTTNQKTEANRSNNKTFQKNSNNSYKTTPPNKKELNSRNYADSSQSISNTKHTSTQINKPSSTQTPVYTGTINDGGTTQLKMNESLDTTTIMNNVSVSNSFTSTNISKLVPVSQNLSGYSNNTGVFSITNIVATSNYTNIDNNTNPGTLTEYPSDPNQYIAQEFTINIELNITEIRVVYSIVNTPKNGGSLSIYTNSGGTPGSVISSSVNSSLATIKSDSDGWRTIIFSKPVTLAQGSYFLVLQDNTSYPGDSTNYFNWGVDGSISTNTGLYVKQYALLFPSWSLINGKLLFTYESIAVNTNAKAVTYSSPLTVNLKYNGNILTNLTNNQLNLLKSTAIFTANISVMFNFTYQIHYNRSNPITTTITYTILNNSQPSWNVTVTTNSVPRGSYSVSNRTFILYPLPSDWNKTSILQNESIFSNFMYTNGSSTIFLNITTSLSAYFWSFNFISPNYITALTLLQNNSKLLSAPYQINTTDTLHVLATMSSGGSGTNGSLLVYDPANTLNFSLTGIDSVANQLNFSLWNVSQTLSSNSNPNGTYTVVVQWINTTQLKIGYLGVNVQIIAQTGLSISSDTDNYLTGQIIHLTANFFSYLNKTDLNGATLEYKVGWNNTSGGFTQTGNHLDYSANIVVDTSVPIGTANITINATLGGYVNQTTVISFNIVHNASLSYQIVENQVYYGDTIHIKIFYNDSITSTFLNQSTVTVNNTLNSTTLQGQNIGQYYYNNTDTANIIPYVSTLHLQVNASHVNYLPKQIVITVPLLPTPTIITPVSGSSLNKSILPTKYFSVSSADTILESIFFNDSRHNNVTIFGANTPTTNITSSIATITSYENTSTGIWILSINPNENGTYPIMFTFTKAGYQPAVYIITLNITITPTTILTDGTLSWSNDSIVNIYYDNGINNESFFITYNDTIYNQTIQNYNYTIYNQTKNTNITHKSFLNGTTSFILNFNATGLYEISIKIYQSGYISQIIIIKVIIWAPGSTTPSIPDNTQVNTSSTTIDGQWSSSITFSLTYFDPQNNILIIGLLNGGNISWNELSSIGTYTVIDEGNGTYLITVTLYKMGTFTVNFTLHNGANLSPYFNIPPALSITFVISKRSTATIININSLSNNTATVYYQRNATINITVKDSILNILANGTLQIDNGTVWIHYIKVTNNNVFYFTINGIDARNITIIITFNSNFFTSQTFIIYISCLDLPTNPVKKINTNGYLNATTSKLGFTYETQYNWTYEDNNSLIIDPSYTIYINGLLITNYNSSGLYPINSTTGSGYSIYLLVYLLPKYLFDKGIYNFTIVFSKFGLNTRMYSFVLNVEGFNVKVILSYPTTLVTGSDYTIGVQITYDNSTTTTNASSLTIDTTNTAGNIRLMIFINSYALAQNINIGDPLGYFNITFIVYVLFTNSTNATLTGSTYTNNQGFAYYTIHGNITSQISQIYGIGADIPSSTYNEAVNYMNTTVGSHITITNTNIYFMYVIVIVGAVIIAVIAFLSMFFLYNKKRSSKRLKLQALIKKNEEYTQMIHFVSNIYNILISSASGLPVANISNAFYRNSPETNTLISGLSVSIDSFLYSFQTDFMTQIGETQLNTDESQNEEKVKLSTIQREKFQIMIAGTENFRIFVFMREKPPKRAEEIFSNIIQDLEANISLRGFIDENVLGPRCEEIIGKYFPLTLLSKFTIDIDRLKTIDRELRNGQSEVSLTANAILALKRLALVRSGAIDSLQGSPEKQGKDFDELVAKNQFPPVGIFHFDIAYSLLEKTLKISLEDIYTALWKGADPMVKLVIPAIDVPAT